MGYASRPAVRAQSNSADFRIAEAVRETYLGSARAYGKHHEQSFMITSEENLTDRSRIELRMDAQMDRQDMRRLRQPFRNMNRHTLGLHYALHVHQTLLHRSR